MDCGSHGKPWYLCGSHMQGWRQAAGTEGAIESCRGGGRWGGKLCGCHAGWQQAVGATRNHGQMGWVGEEANPFFMGIPALIKTDNAPEYVFKKSNSILLTII